VGVLGDGKPRRRILEEVIEDISTIKKKKNEGGGSSVNPVHLTREFLKEHKNKCKTKKMQINHHLNKSAKINQTKKHQRKISEFLIDD
jgi:hypothetical protein